MKLAIFDLDNTLLGGDSDHAWGVFLCRIGAVDEQAYQAANDLFYQQYQQGTLDINEFLSFALRPLSQYSLTQLHEWHRQFMQECIEPLMLPAAQALIEDHRRQGHLPMIITATNAFVTRPIAQRLGIDTLLATEPELVEGRYTGRLQGTPCFQEGKVTRLQQWLSETGHSLQGSYFYSDSRNDLPLLEQVDHPVAVNPDATLAEIARSRNWPILDLRQP